MTQIDAKLFNALTAAADRTLPRASAIAVYAAAAQLAAAPKLAKAWARVLGEHTAPEASPVTATPHPFKAHANGLYCINDVDPTVWPGQACTQVSGAPVHLMETLSPEEGHHLARMVAAGSASCHVPSHIGHRLESLALAHCNEPDGGPAWCASARGRAWLEAHPREGATGVTP